MRADLLVDPRTGVVTGMGTLDLGGRPHARQATVCETAHFGLASGGPATSGCSWRDVRAAGRAALGEAVERYCGHLVPAARLRWGSYAGWRSQGIDAVDPVSLALYRPDQHRRPGFPFAGLAADDEVAWVDGRDPAGRAVLVPAALVWLAPGAHSAGRAGAQVTLPVNAGIAAGPTLAAARRAALAEVVERHALAQAWHGGSAFVAMSAGPPASRHWAVPNRFGAAVVLAMRHEPATDVVGVGCGTGQSWAQAGEKAELEAALMVRTAAMVANGLEAWQRPHGPLAHWRGDRLYSASYRSDLADATDVTCHLQLLADPSVRTSVERRLGALAGELPPVASQDLDQVLVAQGLRPVTVDLTTADVAGCGLAVARVVVPGLRATGPAAFPYLGDGADPLPAEPCLLPVPHV